MKAFRLFGRPAPLTPIFLPSRSRWVPILLPNFRRVPDSRAMATGDASLFNTQFKVGFCQTGVSSDKAESLSNARRAVDEAVQQGAQLVMLGEMFSCPYATKFFWEYGEKLPQDGEVPGDESPTVKLLTELAQKHSVWLIGGTLPEIDGDKVYNTCLVFNASGAIVGRHRKVHLFDIDVPASEGRPAIRFKESDVLSAGDQITVVDMPWCKVGIGICYDLRFPEYALALRNLGAKLVVYPGAFNTNTGPAHWSLLARGRANDLQCWVALPSPARSENPDDYQAWGHSMLVTPWGDVVCEAEHVPSVTVAEVDPSKADDIRVRVPTSKQKRRDLYMPYAVSQ